jgi:hypothetical protein
MAHTEGPWDVDDDTLEIFSITPGHSTGWIAKVLGNDDNGRRLPPDEMAANARLIAAAPEMRRALYRVIAECNCALDYVGVDDAHTLQRALNRVGKASKVCEDAIAKAEGGK